MIITRSPLRISLGGGGTDLPSYYKEHTGFLIAAAIDRHVYMTLHRTFEPGVIAKYSRMERAQSVADLQHPILREALKLTGFEGEQWLEVTSMSDIPAGTGLGSSGSFTTALLQALFAWKNKTVSRSELAETACKIEIELLNEPVGKQDQYIAAYGGLNAFTFNPDGHVDVRPLNVSQQTLYNLEDGLVLYFTGYTRSASAILKDQDVKSKQGDPDMAKNLHSIKEFGMASMHAIESGDLKTFAEIMNEHWQSKRKRSTGMTNARIDELYELGLKHGAIGGKLVGAGGGGFLMFYTPDRQRLRQGMAESGLTEVRFRFDFSGTTVLVQN